MEEIAKIISAITEVTGLDRFSITYGKTDECKRARGILCYIALKDKYGLTQILTAETGKNKNQCLFMSQMCEDGIAEDMDYLKTMNQVRKKLNLASLMEAKINEHEKAVRRSKRALKKEQMKQLVKTVFGIEYTPEDDRRRKEAIRSASEFMQQYCKIGLQDVNRIVRHKY